MSADPPPILEQYLSFSLRPLAAPGNTPPLDTFSQFWQGRKGFAAGFILKRRECSSYALYDHRYQEHNSKNGNDRYQEDDQRVFQHALTMLPWSPPDGVLLKHRHLQCAWPE
jgi:hypothetical protein